MVLRNLLTEQQRRNRQGYDLWTRGEGRESEMHGKSNMETYITICKTDSQWEIAVWLRKLRERLCVSLEGMGREVPKRGVNVHLWLVHVEV